MNIKFLFPIFLLSFSFDINQKTNSFKTNRNQNVVLNRVQSEEEEEPEGCTFFYAGKNCTEDGLAVIARTCDSSPNAMNLNLQITEHNELANKEVTSYKGFKYMMPSETYRFIGTPRNPKMNKGTYWGESTVNENGVVCSGTLSCYANEEAKGADPLCEKTGIGEDNYAQIVGALARTAKEGIDIITKIIDEVGTAENNGVMIGDKNESWYLETYTGHQYIAIKLPDDKCCSMGNEFTLDALNNEEYSYLKDEDIVYSKDLFNLPKENGFLYPTDAKNLKEMHLTKTYAEHNVNPKCHTRTWRGFDLYEKNHYYDEDEDIPTFFTPNRKLNNTDITNFFRDRYENILDDPAHPSHTYFKNLEENNNLRVVATEGAYQIHLLKVHPDLDSKIAGEAWICFSNSNYAPFIPLSSSILDADERFLHVSDCYGYDPLSATSIFKRLNALAYTNRKLYGLNTQNVFTEYEKIWNHQYTQVLNKCKELNIDTASKLITNYTMFVQKQALKLSEDLFNDLTLHIANMPTTEYNPGINIKDYVNFYGYTYEKINDTTYTIKDSSQTYTIEVKPTWSKNYDNGTIKIGDDSICKFFARFVDNEVYGSHNVLNEVFATNHLIQDIDLNQFMPKNQKYWLIPVVIVPVIGLACLYCFSSKKKKIK